MSDGPIIKGDYPDPAVVARFTGRDLELPDILALLPHRPPFLFVDRVIDLVPARSAVGLKGVTIGEPYFPGHFPGQPVMPGVLILEALAQVSGIVLLTGVERGERLCYYTGINDARFIKPVRPGMLLELAVEGRRMVSRFGKLMATLAMEARVDGQVVAAAEGSFALV
ncbi:MAG: 3-hydroxyacyl-ACP dehydratase FabZ [Fimbriimonadaceae bacterium]|nr:3-hydroxyacyl-ACP dehydratase FabZ [Fimbriimonadaceae bacterium]